jgi:hypothetical protein
VSSWKSEVSSQEGPASRSLTSNGTLHTSNSSACKTNPISPARPEMGAVRRAAVPRRGVTVQNEPNLVGKGSDAGGQIRKTNQNLGRLGCVGKDNRVGCGSAWERNVQNEPNFARPDGRWRRNVQNEPNLDRPRSGAGGQMRKTNPIRPGRGPVPEETVQNEPNFAPPEGKCARRHDGKRWESPGVRVTAGWCGFP